MKAKRIVSILLTGSMLLSLLPVSALAAAPVFDAPAQTTAKKAAPLVQEADASRSTEEEAATRSSRDLDAENGTAESITTIQLNAAGTPESRGDSGHWKCDNATSSNLHLYDGTFTLQPSSEPGAVSALQVDLYIFEDAKFNGGTIGHHAYNYGNISNGTFQGEVYNYGTISNGKFQGEAYNYGTISGGTFQKPVNNYKTISGGTFQKPVNNYGGTISGGTFQKPVNNYKTISGGTFEEPVEVYAASGNATIEGGTFEKSMALMNDGASIIISDGLFNGAVVDEGCRAPLSITGGLFTKAVDVSRIIPDNLSITGGYFVNKPALPEGSNIAFTTVSDQNGGNFQVPVNDGFSESYTSLFVPSGSSEQPNTITVKTDTALLDCRAADADADVSIMSSVVSKGGNTYEIPVRGYEKIVLVTEVPAPPTPDEPGELDPAFSSGAAALGIVLGTAGLGYATYVYGSSLYLHYALPDGFIPSTRQELANVLWTTAGKPDPVSTTLYTDIPADAIEQQKAARWCAEQGLLSDHGATFGPDTKVTNARIIRAWNSLKKVPVTITK
ncbi:MAG TPA: hypothetical protein DCZ68_07190 [Faecalibacterium sp.]|nr:hypothetical protein [Faecalibacterium sp.]